MTLNSWPADTLVAGHPALDFLNTAGGTDKSRALERLAHWEDVVRFARAAGLVDAAEARRIAEDADGAHGAEALHRLRGLREDLFEELRSCAGAPYIPGLALPGLGGRLAEVIHTARLHGRGDRFVWDVDYDATGLDIVGARVLLALEGLVTGDDLHRLRECGRCSWLFLDTSRGRGRRWCRMDACGNRNKAARHRARHAD